MIGMHDTRHGLGQSSYGIVKVLEYAPAQRLSLVRLMLYFKLIGRLKKVTFLYLLPGCLDTNSFFRIVPVKVGWLVSVPKECALNICWANMFMHSGCVSH